MVMSQNPRFNSGMGRVGREISKQLSKYHDVHVYGQTSSGGPPREFEGFTLHGNPVQDPTGMQMLPMKLQQIDPDLLITNLNYQQLEGLSQPLNNLYMNSGKEIPVFLYTAIESARPIPGLYERLISQHLNDVFLIPFNEPNYEMFREDDQLEPHIPTFIPHGIDHSVFEPKPEEMARQFWRNSNIDPDSFKFFFCGENWRRKRVDKLCHAFSILKHEKEVGDAKLVLHTSAGPSRGDSFFGGWDIASGPQSQGPDPMLDIYDLSLGEDVHITKMHSAQFIPDEQLATMYSGSDAHVLPSGGEGFGMTLLESMACGTPCIVTDLKEARWLCQNSALYVEPEGKELMRYGEVLKTPSAEDMAEKMLEMYEMSESERGKMAEKGKQRAEDFSWRRTGREFVELIDRYQDGEL